jgi:hypothetical protein
MPAGTLLRSLPLVFRLGADLLRAIGLRMAQVAALLFWVVPTYAIPIVLLAQGLGLVPAPLRPITLFSGATLLAAIGVWGAVFAQPALARRQQPVSPRLAAFFTVHPLLAWLLAVCPPGYGAAVYFSALLATLCGWVVAQSAAQSIRQSVPASDAPQLDWRQPTASADSQPTAPPGQSIPSAAAHRIDGPESLTGPHWLARRGSAFDSKSTQSAGPEPKESAAPDVLPLITARQQAAQPGYRLERCTAGWSEPSQSQGNAGQGGGVLPQPGDPTLGESISGSLVVRFAAHQKQQVVHIPFWPPFAFAPAFECEAEGDAEVRLATHVFPYGVRIELKRTSDATRPETISLAFHGEQPAAKHRSAA